MAWRQGSALSSRTAPRPPHRRSARCSCSDCAPGRLIFRTAGAALDVRTGSTIDPGPWVGSPSRRRSHRCNWLCVTLPRSVPPGSFPPRQPPSKLTFCDAIAADSLKALGVRPGRVDDGRDIDAGHHTAGKRGVASIDTPMRGRRAEEFAVDATPFGHYQLQKLIGRGGMGEVYRAYDTKTDRIVALKVLPHHMAEDATFQHRFRRESQAAAGLNEPHVVPIHSYGEIDGRLYLEMRLIEGRNLGTILDETEKPLGPAFASMVVEQVGAALDAAHEAGLIHRDVKPSNILLTDHDFVYLIDFGLARTAGEVGMTTAGSTLGTLAYMAPERFDGGQAAPRSDIYALTCVLYECVPGSRPEHADSDEQQIKGHMVSPPPRPSAIDPKLAAFAELIAKGMAKKPAKRYQSAGELAAATRRALSVPVRTTGRSGRHSAQPSAVGRRVSRRALVVAGGGGVVGGAVAVGAWQLWGGSNRGDARPASLAESSKSGPGEAPNGAVPAIAATVPAGLRATGRLVIGVNVPYAPNEFKNSADEIIGFDVDLMNAVAKTLGLVPDYRETAFETIMRAVSGGDFNVGMSSFTDT